MTSYVKLHREVFDHELFAGDELSRREALLWLIAQAAWDRDGRAVYVGGRRVVLGRGELCHPVRLMAEAWRWLKRRVHRFLTQLEPRR